MLADSTQLTPREALVALFNATNGPSWGHNEGWLSAAPICTWYGVECQNSTVVALNLGDNQLAGTIPAVFAAFPSLQTLQLLNNQLYGQFPFDSLQPSLRLLTLEDNKFSGPLPDFHRFKQLSTLDVANNAFSAIGSNSLGASLTVLILRGNPLNSAVPKLSHLNALERLDIGQCRFTGELPLVNSSRLADFIAIDNRFHGSVPTFKLAPNVKFIALFGNALTGELPSLAHLLQLKNFYAGKNQLHGTIPAFPQPNFAVLDVENNRFTGSVPALAGSVFWVSVAGNRLTGSLPSFQQNLALEELLVTNNNLSGTVPALNHLVQLSNLDLSANFFSGSLPFLQLPKLQRLFLRENRFVGSIPPWIIPTIEEIDISQNPELEFDFAWLSALVLRKLQFFTATGLKYKAGGVNRRFEFDALQLVDLSHTAVKEHINDIMLFFSYGGEISSANLSSTRVFGYINDAVASHVPRVCFSV